MAEDISATKDKSIAKGISPTKDSSTIRDENAPTDMRANAAAAANMNDKTVSEAKPVYRHDAAYAAANGERDQYLASHRENIACKNAIEDAVRTNFDGMNLNKDAAKDVINRFGPERVEYVLAVTLQNKDWDGRFSRDNKDWAAGIETVPNIDSDGNDRQRAYVIDSHPVILDGFIDLAKDEIAVRILSLTDYLSEKGVDNITDDEKFMEAEFETVRDWCDAHGYNLSAEDKAEIERRGLTDMIEDLKEERGKNKAEIKDDKSEQNESKAERSENNVVREGNETERGKNEAERNEKPLTADEITNIKCVSSEYAPHLRTATHTLECEIRGVPDVLIYKVMQHDYGDGFTLHSENNDIWNTMDRKEMLQLEDVVSEEVTFHELSESIDKAETMRDLRDIRFDIVEGDDLNLSDEHIAKLYNKMDEQETALIEASLTPVKDDKKSVLEGLNEKREETGKMSERAKSKIPANKEVR